METVAQIPSAVAEAMSDKEPGQDTPKLPHSAGNKSDETKAPSQQATEAQEIFDVVMDVEDRYSVWPSLEEVPKLWRKEGFFGPKKDCLEYIQRVWIDMRPKSLKEEMAKWEPEFAKRRPSDEKLKRLAEERDKAVAAGIDHFHSE